MMMISSINRQFPAVVVSVFAVLSILFSSCEKITGEGPVITQERSISNFKAINAGVSGRVSYSVSPVTKLEITAQQNILDVLETFVSNNELVIKYRNGVNVRSHEEIVVKVSAPSPESIAISGSGGFDLTGGITGEKLNLRVSGSGNMQVDKVTLTDKLDLTVSGSGNISIVEGVAAMQSARISGSGNIQTAAVSVQTAEADISGSGNIKLQATQRLNARISGSGSVYYAGTPVISTHISGSGNVRPL